MRKNLRDINESFEPLIPELEELGHEDELAADPELLAPDLDDLPPWDSAESQLEAQQKFHTQVLELMMLRDNEYMTQLYSQPSQPGSS